MAAKLQCEICGGKLIGKPGGIFECDSCGMEYSTAWAKEKIQEISGTVKVEGTVEVTGKVQVEGGTVQVEGAATAVSFLRRGELALEDKNWNDARSFFDKVLDVEPENPNAYLGKLLAKRHCTSTEGLKASTKPLDDESNYQKAMRFGNEALRTELQVCAEAILANIVAQEQEAKARKEEQEAREKAEKEREKEEAQKRIEYLKSVLPSVGGKMGIYAASYDGWGVFDILLKSDGTVITFGSNTAGRCDLSHWTDIIAVSAGVNFSMGLKSDGTVMTTLSWFSKYKDWNNIIAIAAGYQHMVALRADGTVVAEGDNYDGQCNVSDWKGIVAIAAGQNHTVGLRADGRVIATQYLGNDYRGQCEVSSWRDIVVVAASRFHTIGLRADGTVIAAGENWNGVCEVSNWKNIVAISTGFERTMGLISDGTVVTTNTDVETRSNLPAWNNIVALGQGGRIIVSLDGTAGRYYGTAGRYKLFSSFEEEWDRVKKREYEWRKAAAEKAEAERKAKIKALSREQAALQTELADLRGLFSGKRRREIETRLAEIEAELKKLQ